MKEEISGLSSGQRTLAIVLITYIVTVTIQRFAYCLSPWVAETDWKQWVWQYWRYHVEGAFPPGNVITDYTFNAQPPLYFGLMAALSSLVRPVLAANIINWFAWGLGLWACVVAVTRRSTVLVGLMVALLLVRDDTLHKFSMGGYPRSFGPTLTLLFLAAWLNGRHRLTLGVLIVGAGVYPSICVPCGLAYGLWTVATTPAAFTKAWLQKNAEVLVAGVVIGVVAQLQSLTAPSWWGPVVWASEAGPELSAAGRTHWLPLGAFWPRVSSYFFEVWNFSGAFWKDNVIPWPQRFAHLLGLSAAVVAAGFTVVKGRRAPLPWQLVLAFACAVFSFFLARVVAFKLYLPHRMVQHTVPPIVVVSLGLLFFTAGMTWYRHVVDAAQRRARASVFVLVCLIVPQFVLSGDGMGSSSYRSYAARADLYTWIQNNTKVEDQFAGYYSILDEIPFFAVRQVYVNWKMAHPFRKGFFAEIEKRTIEMYAAYYCTDLHDLLSFSTKNKIEWFVVNDTMFDRLEKGDSQLFEPTRGKILETIFAPRAADAVAHPFALRDPPREIVAFQLGNIRVLSMAALHTLLAAPAP